jgi:hypothetical protein
MDVFAYAIALKSQLLCPDERGVGVTYMTKAMSVSSSQGGGSTTVKA